MKRILLVLCLVIAGCSEAPTSIEAPLKAPAAVPSTGKDASISWYDGSIDSAFATAKAEDRPIFLYWGAVWCPPCQEIKHTVFKSQEFINLTRLFVPVYLDGDTERAQSWGDQFGVMGYPTMIVFNPAGEELTRLPGNIDTSRYNSVLELSLNQMKPMSGIVQTALEDVQALTEADYRQLAYYSWFQDVSALPEDTDEQALFSALAANAPAGELSTRFTMLYLLAKLEQEEAVLADSEVDQLQSILASDELTLAAWDTLAYWSEEILAMMPEDRREDLAEQWWQQTFELRFAESLSKAEKLAGWFPRLSLLTRDDQVLPEDIQAQIRTELAAVDRATPDSFERQSVVNQMGHVYRQAGMIEDARVMLTSELEKSASPYYFMSSLGSIAERGERFDEALSWRQQAYEAAEGQATRFQWGTDYVRAMIRMAPAEEEKIVKQAVALLDEFDDQRQLLARRNFARLQRLSADLAGWREARLLESGEFTAKIQALCAGQSAGSPESENCLNLVQPLAAS